MGSPRLKAVAVAMVAVVGLGFGCGNDASGPDSEATASAAGTTAGKTDAGGANGDGAGTHALGGGGGSSASDDPSRAGSRAGNTGGHAGSDGSSGASGNGAGTGSCKRGVAYGHHTIADLTALSEGVAWWYNWDFQPDQDLRSGAYRDVGVEYVPMIWGAKSDRAAAKLAIGDDARALLGFNEPNFGSQANLSAQAAAALWPELEAIADAKGLRLVSPAPNFCGGDCQDTDPFHYLDAFFAACSGCRVDAVAMHIYVGCSPAGDHKAQWLIQHVETYKQRFTQPLWLTEFACDSAKSEAEQQAFLEDAVAYLEAEPRIERYAWFSGRASNVAHVDLLGDTGQLTALGQAYVNAPRNAACMR